MLLIILFVFIIKNLPTQCNDFKDLSQNCIINYMDGCDDEVYRNDCIILSNKPFNFRLYSNLTYKNIFRRHGCRLKISFTYEFDYSNCKVLNINNYTVFEIEGNIYILGSHFTILIFEFQYGYINCYAYIKLNSYMNIHYYYYYTDIREINQTASDDYIISNKAVYLLESKTSENYTSTNVEFGIISFAFVFLIFLSIYLLIYLLK